MTRDALCKLEGDELVIRLALPALAAGTEVGLPDQLQWGDGEPPNVEVTDQRAWGESVVSALTEEAENGETRITKMLDSAILHAYEQGGDGVEVAE